MPSPLHPGRLSPPPLSPRALIVAAWFGLTYSPTKRTQPHPPTLKIPLPRPGQILLITGPSGAGKSSLLRALRSRARRPWLDLANIPLLNKPIIDLLPDLPIQSALQSLARVGLAEAHSYLCTPDQLSEGQRFRLRLAVALHQSQARPVGNTDQHARTSKQQLATSNSPRNSILASDEFAALLDRVTAAVISHALRRAIDRTPNLSAILATSHDDLIDPLAPDCIVYCDFGNTTITHHPRQKEAQP